MKGGDGSKVRNGSTASHNRKVRGGGNRLSALRRPNPYLSPIKEGE